MHPTLMQVPPYILSDFSIIATVFPLAPSLPARVLPPLPKPITIASYCFTKMPSFSARVWSEYLPVDVRDGDLPQPAAAELVEVGIDVVHDVPHAGGHQDKFCQEFKVFCVCL